MELKVWVEGIQRVICGVTEDTTCQDVVIALAHATGKTGRFTLIEKWRDNERLVPPSDCPLKLLRNWGEYAGDVQYQLKYSGGDNKSRSGSISSNKGGRRTDNQFSHNFTPHQRFNNNREGDASIPGHQRANVKRNLTFSGAHHYSSNQLTPGRNNKHIVPPFENSSLDSVEEQSSISSQSSSSPHSSFQSGGGGRDSGRSQSTTNSQIHPHSHINHHQPHPYYEQQQQQHPYGYPGHDRLQAHCYNFSEEDEEDTVATSSFSSTPVISPKDTPTNSLDHLPAHRGGVTNQNREVSPRTTHQHRQRLKPPHVLAQSLDTASLKAQLDTPNLRNQFYTKVDNGDRSYSPSGVGYSHPSRNTNVVNSNSSHSESPHSAQGFGYNNHQGSSNDSSNKQRGPEQSSHMSNHTHYDHRNQLSGGDTLLYSSDNSVHIQNNNSNTNVLSSSSHSSTNNKISSSSSSNSSSNSQQNLPTQHNNTSKAFTNNNTKFQSQQTKQKPQPPKLTHNHLNHNHQKLNSSSSSTDSTDENKNKKNISDLSALLLGGEKSVGGGGFGESGVAGSDYCSVDVPRDDLVRLVNLQVERLNSQEDRLRELEQEVSVYENRDVQAVKQLQHIKAENIKLTRQEAEAEGDIEELELVSWVDKLHLEEKNQRKVQDQLDTLQDALSKCELELVSHRQKAEKLHADIESEKKLQSKQQSEHKEQEIKTLQEISDLQKQINQKLVEHEHNEKTLNEVATQLKTLESSILDRKTVMSGLEQDLKGVNLELFNSDGEDVVGKVRVGSEDVGGDHSKLQQTQSVLHARQGSESALPFTRSSSSREVSSRIIPSKQMPLKDAIQLEPQGYWV